MTLLQKTPFSIKVVFSKKTDFFRKPHFGGILGGGQNGGQKSLFLGGSKKAYFRKTLKNSILGYFGVWGKNGVFGGISGETPWKALFYIPNMSLNFI